MKDIATDPKFLLALALIIGMIVRLLKSDTKIPIDVPPRLRGPLALLLGLLVGVIENVAGGVPWKEAILGGLGAAVGAMVGHTVVIESLFGGKEIPIPLLMKDKPAEKKDPPSDDSPIPPAAAIIILGSVALGISQDACTPKQEATLKSIASDKAQCIAQKLSENADIADKDVWIQCAIEDPLRYLDLLRTQRIAMKRAATPRASSERSDAGVEAGCR